MCIRDSVKVRFPIVGKTWITTTSNMAGRVLKDDATFTMRKDGTLAGLRWWMPRKREWSGSSMLSMLTASVPIERGIHQRQPASVPSLRMVKVALSFSTRLAMSLVVVIQVLPTMGKRTLTSAPAALSSLSPGSGFFRSVSYTHLTLPTIYSV